MDNTFISYPVEERSYVAYIKREIHNQLAHTHFSKNRIAEIDIIVAELTSNLIKHAGSGELLYRIYNEDDKHSVFEILCLDNGPGISDITKVMKDGVSTANTLGHGLGALQRLSSFFQIYSIPKWGCIQYSRVVGEKPLPKVVNNIEVKAVCIPKALETKSGDGYAVKQTREESQIFFGDGLGHGQYAHEAVQKARDFFFECRESDPVEIIRQMHASVRRSRGLVGMVAVLDKKRNEWRLCGVGNILARIYSGIEYKNYMSYNGTIGLNIPTSMNATVFPCERNQHIIMCSDGIRTRWDITRYPSIWKYDGMILAAALYKDFTRRTDDASVLVGKVN